MIMLDGRIRLEGFRNLAPRLRRRSHRVIEKRSREKSETPPLLLGGLLSNVSAAYGQIIKKYIGGE